jgi:hypothetical protein
MIIITKIQNSDEINKKLLDFFKKIDNPFSENISRISNTDWSLPREQKREYLDYFSEIIKPYMFKIASKLYSESWNIHNFWFQQYLKSDNHNWHTHPDCQFTNVYFVELPDESLSTQILGHEKVKAKEGELLTFPAYFYHRSPINNSNKRKTIISFNSSFFDFNEKIENTKD